MRRHAITLLLLLIACSEATAPKPEPLSALPRPLSAAEIGVARAGNQFAFAIFKQLSAAQPSENVFISPLSISFALGMAMNGADGSTLDEMRTTLGFGATDLAQINGGYRSLLALEGGLDPSTTFQIANSAWYRQEFSFKPAFFDTVQRVFDATVQPADFANPSTVDLINSWVRDKTKGKIPSILDSIDPAEVMFLINAIYFKGSWRDRFDPRHTSPGPFTTIDGATQHVPMMRHAAGETSVRMSTIENLTVGELPYGNTAFVMTILIPPPDSVNAVIAGLDTATWTSYVDRLREQDVEVQLPKFKLEYKRSLRDDLEALGMRIPFSDFANFARMTDRSVAISRVDHKTFVDVNEEGTEAAAVTNVGIRITSAPPALRVDRPFILVLRERFSGTILFIGKVVRIPA